jgi:D-alanyl-D-alanine carboxypeptidase
LALRAALRAIDAALELVAEQCAPQLQQRGIALTQRTIRQRIRWRIRLRGGEHQQRAIQWMAAAPMFPAIDQRLTVHGAGLTAAVR